MSVYSPLSPPSPPTPIKKKNEIYSPTIVPVSLIIYKFKETNQKTLTQICGQKNASSSDENSDDKFVKKKKRKHHPTPIINPKVKKSKVKNTTLI